MRTPDEIRDASVARFNELAGNKFDAGQKEHGSCLDDTVTPEKLEEEVIDMWHYLQSLREQNRKLLDMNQSLQRMIDDITPNVAVSDIAITGDEDDEGWVEGGQLD